MSPATNITKSEAPSAASNGSDVNPDIQTLTLSVNDLSRSLGNLNAWYLGVSTVAVVAALAVLIFQARIIVKGKALSAAQTDLLAAKDKKLELDLKQKDVEIGAAQKVAAEANRTAEAERLARVKIEERLAWRRIDPELFGQLVQRLQPYAGSTVDIWNMGDGDPEVDEFVRDISRVFSVAHWVIRPHGGTFLPAPRGLACSADKTVPAGKELLEAAAKLPTASCLAGPLGTPSSIKVGLKPPP